MKSKILVFFLFLLSPLSMMKAQTPEFSRQVNVGYDACFLKDFTFRSINLQYTLFPEDKISFHYSLGFGTANNMFHAHYPLSSFAGVYLLASSGVLEQELLATIAILSFAIPEGISYNINIDDKTKFSPYLIFNSHEFYFNQEKKEELNLSIGFGSRISYKVTPHLGFAISTGLKLIYDEGAGIHTTASIYYRY